MAKNSIPVESFLEAAQVFHWATKRHFQLWFTGQVKRRHKRIETVLRRLSARKKLRAVRYGKGLIYALPRKTKGFDVMIPKVVHGLACTECLVRFYRARTDGEVVAERFFYGLGSVPEWGIIYPEEKMILFEYCTKSNFYFTGNMRGKIAAYKSNLHKIEEKFNAKALVVFVLDVPSGVVERHAGSVAGAPYEGDTFPSYPFFFTDYETFKQVPIGEQLTAPIYFWTDGKQYPLRQNV